MENWMQSMLYGYESNDIFNADETRLFLNVSLIKLTFKNDKCHGEKHSKDV